MDSTEQILKEIRERNKRVEADKAWETSATRRLFIAGITYLTALLFLWTIETPNFTINALVPTGGYLLSTLSLSKIKKSWLKHYEA